MLPTRSPSASVKSLSRRRSVVASPSGILSIPLARSAGRRSVGIRHGIVASCDRWSHHYTDGYDPCGRSPARKVIAIDDLRRAGDDPKTRASAATRTTVIAPTSPRAERRSAWTPPSLAAGMQGATSRLCHCASPGVVANSLPRKRGISRHLRSTTRIARHLYTDCDGLRTGKPRSSDIPVATIRTAPNCGRLQLISLIRCHVVAM